MHRTCVVGVGSPHGDDAVGWLLAEELRQRDPTAADVVALRSPTELLGRLSGCRKLILVDACSGGQPAGTIRRLTWPDSAIAALSSPSSHGLGVGTVLALAEALGELPPEVVVYAVEMNDCLPGQTASDMVRRALPELCRCVLAEVNQE
jgi:hydrogenase maturation protease